MKGRATAREGTLAKVLSTDAGGTHSILANPAAEKFQHRAWSNWGGRRRRSKCLKKRRHGMGKACGICLNRCCRNDRNWKFVNLPTVFFGTNDGTGGTDGTEAGAVSAVQNENGRRKSGRGGKRR